MVSTLYKLCKNIIKVDEFEHYFPDLENNFIITGDFNVNYPTSII